MLIEESGGVFRCNFCVQGRIADDVAESRNNGVERVLCI